MTERHAVWTSALLATFAIVALWTFGNADASFPARPMAYVVCGDDRFQDNRVFRGNYSPPLSSDILKNG